MTINNELAVFGSGCFWCSEAIFSRLRGVLAVSPGYAGGQTADPTYEEVCSGKTGHAEVAKVVFDPTGISYEQLLDVFFHTHDPTSLNQQGADHGTQYRSIILFTTSKQEMSAIKYQKMLEKEKEFARPIVTEIKPLGTFYPAEDYHQNYFQNHPFQPYCQVVISPKMKHFSQRYQALIK